MVKKTLLCLIGGLIFSSLPPVAQAEPSDDEVIRLRAENAQLRQQNASLQSQQENLQKEVTRLEDAQSGTSSLNPTPEQKKKLWSIDVALGGNLTRGNTSSSQLNLDINSVRKTDQDKLTLYYNMEYGVQEGATNIDRMKSGAQYDREISDRWYWLALGNGERDSIAGLDYRFTSGPGLGYHAITTKEFTLDLEGGPLAVLEKQEHQPSEFTPRARAAEKFEYRITPGVRLFQDAEVLQDVTNAGNWLFNADVGMETKITHALSLRVVGQDRYDNNPTDNKQKNDMTLTTSIVYKY